MSIFKKIRAGYRQVLSSTNGTLNILTAFLMAAAASVNFPEAPLEGLIAAVVPLLAVVREWVKGGVKFRFNGNVFAYLASAFVLVAPWSADLFEAMRPIVDALLRGDVNAIWTALIPLVNVLWYLFRDKPWEEPEGNVPTPDRVPGTSPRPGDPRAPGEDFGRSR